MIAMQDDPEMKDFFDAVKVRERSGVKVGCTQIWR